MKRKSEVLAVTVAAALWGCALSASAQQKQPTGNLVKQTAGKAEAGRGDKRREEERLSFQSFAPYGPRIHLDADVAMVYGIDKTLPERIETWRKQGYRIHVMTGVSWGEYQDYLYGRFDGENHEDEAQTERNGSRISHGGDVYYMSPGESYGRFLSRGVKRALDAGAEAVHLEEPEFWVRSGYEPNFKREWQAYYGEEWQPPHSSPDAQWRASKLKYFLYRRALSQVFAFVKDYGRKTGRTIPCYVPTHSLINYAHWRIVSPASSLLSVGCDGYIAQVWTGTARTPNVYEGRRKERTFETAFLEYGAMQNLVRASGKGQRRRIWYLNDPIEDNPNHSWDDYRRNWENTLTASLLQPEVWRYEIMPWPDRIFTGAYPIKEASERMPGETVAKVGIPAAYETELQAVINALGDMKQPASRVRWERSGTREVGVLISDTMMFQRGEPSASDPDLGSFYGLALPLLKYGLPVEPVQIESAATQRDFLKPYRVLLLTYEGQKPPTPDFHKALADWVRSSGGALVVVDDDKDPFNGVREWWNTGERKYRTAREHLFEALKLPPDMTGMRHVGKGVVLRLAASPATLTREVDGAARLRQAAQEAMAAVKLPWQTSSGLVLRRGPYLVAAGLDESAPEHTPAKLTGRFVDLFDASLPVRSEQVLTPGKRALLVDLDTFPKATPRIVAAACRVRQQSVTGRFVRFLAEGIADTDAVVRLILPTPPRAVRVNGKDSPPGAWDYEAGTLRLRFANAPQGVDIEIER
jgi:hypothetical protein